MRVKKLSAVQTWVTPLLCRKGPLRQRQSIEAPLWRKSCCCRMDCGAAQGGSWGQTEVPALQEFLCLWSSSCWWLRLRLRWSSGLPRVVVIKRRLFCLCSASVAELAVLCVHPGSAYTYPLNMIKHLKYKVKNNRKLHRRKASVYSTLKQRAGRNCAPKWSDDLKNCRVLWQRMRKR